MSSINKNIPPGKFTKLNNHYHSEMKQLDTDVERGLQPEIDFLLHSMPIIKENFIIKEKIGEGTFSSVYLAKVKCGSNVNKYVAIKHIIPTSHPNRVMMELDCMQKFGGRANVMGVHTCIREASHVVLVMPYFRHDIFPDYIGNMDMDEIRQYFRNLLEALQVVHAGGIIHRDVKPSNFLYCRKKRSFALVDFGLAQYADTLTNKRQALSHSDLVKASNLQRPKERSLERTIGSESYRTRSENIPSCALVKVQNHDCIQSSGGSGKAFLKLMPLAQGSSKISSNVHVTVRTKDSDLQPNIGGPTTCHCFGQQQVCLVCLRRPAQVASRAGTPGFRPPEVLLKHPHQTTAVDIWSVGVMLLCVLSERYPFFNASDDLSALAEIITLFGTESVREFAGNIKKTLTCSPEKPPLDLKTVCEKLRRGGAPADSVPPLDSERELAYDLLKRLLQLDPSKRVTAAVALLHPFFN